MDTAAAIRSAALALSAATVLLVGSAPLPAQDGAAAPPRMFETAKQCIACHNGVVGPSGEDVSIGSNWRSTMMANAARDPYWQATIRREVLDHPEAKGEIEAECSTCHMPMASYTARAAGGSGRVFSHFTAIHGVPGAPPPTQRNLLAADGVSCTMCHQIQPDRLGTEESFVGGFVVDSTTPAGARSIFGPFAVDSGRNRLMHSASQFRPVESPHVQQSELCATCHTLYTHARNGEDEVVGELPEQVPYLEWLHSDYRDRRSCQSCHMPVIRQPVPVTGILGQPRDSVNRHVFRGGNFLVLGMLNRYRDELGVQAQPQELAASIQRTRENLQQRTARVSIDEARIASDRLEASVSVRNLAGHKLPTAYPARRVWIELSVRDRSGELLFASGALREGGYIEGNDNDADPTAWEPHHDTIRAEDQVQIYEAIMVDHRDEVTTGVTSGIRYVKDNRILPEGFDESTAGEDIAVQGPAADDPDFVAPGDRVRYSVEVAGSEGPYRVQARLWYQPIAYRWAQNLRQRDAPEIRRFVSYYQSMAPNSAIVLTRTGATVSRDGDGRQ